MHSSDLTVLLPVYNAGSPLRVAIDSLLAQSLQDFDLLIIDDGSTDGSRDLIARYAARDRRVRPVLHDHNIGLAATLNEGLQLSTGGLVARMDQDDEALPERLQRQREFMNQNPDVVVAGTAVFHMGARRRFDRLVTIPTSSDQIRETLRQYNCMYHPSVIMRRERILEMGGYRAEFKNAEDYDLWLRVSLEHGIANLTEPLLRYRFSTSGMTLGRKWEQLSFIYLAQAAHARGSRIDDGVRREAKRMLAETDREYFFRQVANGTILELIHLHMWASAVSILRQFSGEIGTRDTLRLLKLLGAAYLQALAPGSSASGQPSAGAGSVRPGHS